MITRAQFVESFLLPLCAGGAVHVGAPLGGGGLSRLLAEPGDTEVERVLSSARWAIACELQITAIPPALDEHSLRLAVAAHDLLFLHHPAAGNPAARGNKLRQVAAGAAALARLPRTTDADELVARHTVLHLLPSLSRTDVRISFWAGRQEFHGQEPPARLSAWPSVRRVNEERWQVGCLAEAAADAGGGAEVVRALFSGSPLTDLLTPVRLDPRLDFSSLSALLADPEICRIVAYRYLESGIEKVGGAIAQAALALLGARQPGDAAAFALSFVCHLHLCLLAGDREGGSADPRRLGGRGDPALRDFFGLFFAARRGAPALSLPADIERDPQKSRRADEYAAACGEICGPIRSRELAATVARSALGGAIPLAAASG